MLCHLIILWQELELFDHRRRRRKLKQHKSTRICLNSIYHRMTLEYGLVQTEQYVRVQLSGDIADIELISSHISKEMKE